MSVSASRSVIVPSIPPPSNEIEIRIPDSMNEQDRAFLIRELGKLSKDNAVLEERQRTLSNRVDQLEKGASATGEHRALQLDAEIKKLEKREEVWRGRIWSIVAVLLTGAIVALVTHWLSTR